MPDLTGAALKLCRAEEQTKQLEAEFAQFFSTENKAHAVTVHRNADATEWWTTWRVNKLPPDSWPVQVGEIVHNLRSALDYLVYEFSTPGRDGRPLPGIAFPIFIDEAAYRSTKRGGGLYLIRGLDNDRARAVVETVQPFVYGFYTDAREAFAWILHELSNADKHRLLNVATTYQIEGRSMIQWEPNISGIEWMRSPANGVFKDGAEFVRLRVVGATPDTKMHMNSHYTFNILFNESTPSAANIPVGEVLNGAGKLVAAVINEFAKL